MHTVQSILWCSNRVAAAVSVASQVAASEEAKYGALARRLGIRSE